ncbi:dihydrodipicolinate synthase [Beutenbergia cavernae DSM 12333]|uniref:4-hydroxy-tetrahydrodipicolinate synthase n=1 Tax=Beutenbergia cavernae (strain ATCC BAA-8 / DSM 12333 / CCUG 43141 / JCM 11478 / NBRC 16432 / NCIMB 13614 / HKI 0122) TaxID=471853 RepID=C5C6J0_BEUC1|nr:4-hydroxy-tetrahydrodipicolinate synthase [Beutenbergia cavernae]ACQ80396.1 dihydrodipicolinate synthase [Beutenbergia cavernae DSM 12333]
MADTPFGRLLAAVVTPFTPDGHLDLGALERHVDRLVSAGVDGLVVAGTTGESAALGADERSDVVRVATSVAAGRARVVSGTGEHDTTSAIEAARAGVRAGADAVLAPTPAYVRPSQAGVLAHLRAVADAADVPVMLYDNPRRSGVGLELATLERAAAHPNVCAIKDATDDLSRAADILGMLELAYFAGSDVAALPTLALGGTGLVGVAANVAPEEYRQLLDAVSAGDLRAAALAHHRLEPLVRALNRHVPPAVATKVVLRGLGLLPCARVRLPLVGPDAAEVVAIRRDLERYAPLPEVRAGLVRLDHPDALGGALSWPEGAPSAVAV